MKNFFLKKLLIQFFLLTLIPFSITFAQTGCYIRDGSKQLYTSTDGSVSNICGVNAKVYTLSSVVPKNAVCQWAPTFPTGSYNCVIMPGLLCGIEGSFALECPLDDMVLVLMILLAGLGFYILRRYPQSLVNP